MWVRTLSLCEEGYSWNHASCTLNILSKYVRGITGDSVIVCDKPINVADSVSATVTANANRTVPTIFHDKKSRTWDRLLHSGHSFISDHIFVQDRCYLLLSCKTYVKTKKYIVALTI